VRNGRQPRVLEAKIAEASRTPESSKPQLTRGCFPLLGRVHVPIIVLAICLSFLLASKTKELSRLDRMAAHEMRDWLPRYPRYRGVRSACRTDVTLPNSCSSRGSNLPGSVGQGAPIPHHNSGQRLIFRRVGNKRNNSFLGERMQVMANSLAMHTQFAGDLARRPAFGPQRGDGKLQAHVELVHRASGRLLPTHAQSHSQSGRFSSDPPWPVSSAADRIADLTEFPDCVSEQNSARL